MGRARIAVVEDDPDLRDLVQAILGAKHEIHLFPGGQPFLDWFQENDVDLILSDIVMPGLGGLALLERIKASGTDPAMILMTANASVRQAVEVLKAGASDYVQKPFLPEELLWKCDRAIENHLLRRRHETLKRSASASLGTGQLIGDSEAVRRVRDLIAQVKDLDTTVLITGESGTGKELIARAIHLQGSRSERPFVPVNCGAIPRDLMESELFGHVRGAFSGATDTRHGLIEEAAHGTLFLDEISELPLDLQVKLNRVIQERETRRIGDRRTRRVDVRFVAATNLDLARLVKEGRFREDLYYRLKVYPIDVPPLRHRAEDIPQLARHFLDKLKGWGGKSVKDVGPRAAERLIRYAWPGNVRELQNVIERAVIVERGEELSVESLPKDLDDTPAAAGVTVPSGPLKSYRETIRELTDAASLDYFTRLLEEHDGNVSRAARHAELDRVSLHRLLKKYGILPESFRE